MGQDPVSSRRKRNRPDSQRSLRSFRRAQRPALPCETEEAVGAAQRLRHGNLSAPHFHLLRPVVDARSNILELTPQRGTVQHRWVARDALANDDIMTFAERAM